MGRRASRLGALLVACAALATNAGCHSVPTAPGYQQTALKAEPDEKLLPTLAPNPDLFKALRPSNDRVWSKDQAVLARAEIVGDRATIHNVRNCDYRSVNDFTVRHCDKTFDLRKLTSVDFIVVPFNDTPGIAHTMLSFGFEDREYLGVSVEIRKELGEQYSAIRGFFRQYELMYVLADERDLIQKATNHWLCDVFVYRTVATPQQARKLLLDVMERVNSLAEHPEFYDTLRNNCTTNIRNHVNRCFYDKVPYDVRILLPGQSDKLAYDLGLLKTTESFEQTKIRSRVNYQAYLYRDDPDFSVKIRQAPEP